TVIVIIEVLLSLILMQTFLLINGEDKMPPLKPPIPPPLPVKLIIIKEEVFILILLAVFVKPNPPIRSI
ncbi:hypothetical protein OFC13_27805, partial [Escherichia coli]|nr:hypothetical protein [Escherichia coli]